MPNESLVENETEAVAKSSRKDKVYAAMFWTAAIVVPVGISAAAIFVQWKVSTTALETAKINLEAAKLTKL